MFGFQTFKEPRDGATVTEQHAKWCCLAAQGDKPWVIPNGWVANRNARRNLPPGIGKERLRTLSKREDIALEDIIRRI